MKNPYITTTRRDLQNLLTPEFISELSAVSDPTAHLLDKLKVGKYAHIKLSGKQGTTLTKNLDTVLIADVKVIGRIIDRYRVFYLSEPGYWAIAPRKLFKDGKINPAFTRQINITKTLLEYYEYATNHMENVADLWDFEDFCDFILQYVMSKIKRVPFNDSYISDSLLEEGYNHAMRTASLLDDHNAKYVDYFIECYKTMGFFAEYGEYYNSLRIKGKILSFIQGIETKLIQMNKLSDRAVKKIIQHRVAKGLKDFNRDQEETPQLMHKFEIGWVCRPDNLINQ